MAVYDTQTNAIIARKGDAVPDATGTRSRRSIFKSFKDPVAGVLIGDDHIAFPAPYWAPPRPNPRPLVHGCVPGTIRAASPRAAMSPPDWARGTHP